MFCGYPFCPCAALCPWGGCGPSGFYDQCWVIETIWPLNGPFNSWCCPSGSGFWGGCCC
ncbi:hypothetical protein KR059_004524 [Drosophila kikkawai]|nr:hypothetical protein KR059_004524 [Drosophila kikkawai]